jgi:hypothetical protein
MGIKKTKRFLPFLLISLGIIIASTTLTLTSCGVSSSITNNMFKPKDGDAFATYNGKSYGINEAINGALNDKTSTDKFKNAVVNDLLYD